MEKIIKYLGTFSLFIMLFFHCTTNKITIAELDIFEQYLEFQIGNQSIPTMSVVIFRGDSILYENYLGQSNIEENKPLEQNDLFMLASMSKMVTGAALMQLHDEGHFQLDDTINHYLPYEVVVPKDTTNTPITFRMLLTHTSGIADGPALLDQYFFEEDSPVELKIFIKNYFFFYGSIITSKIIGKANCINSSGSNL